MSNAPEYTNVPLGHGEWLRQLADEIEIPLINRYFENNPTNLGDNEHSALISRPGIKRWLQVGNGPIQETYSQPGTFDEALFVVSNQNLYRVDQNEAVTLIGNGVAIDPRDKVSMAATAPLGSTPEYLFIAGGGTLYVYIENGYAIGTLTGTPANGDVVKIDVTYYQWTSGSVDTGTPAGTIGSPWLVAIGVDAETSFTNLYNAINLTGKAGTTYSTATTIHPDTQAISVSTNSLGVRAKLVGSLGNAISTTETGAALAWGSTTLINGGLPYFAQVQTPDAVGVVGVVFFESFVVVIIAQGSNENGRFYWIEPGDLVIDPLNFATAERSPDPVLSGRVVGDQLYLLGSNSTEVWYANTAATDPSESFLRTQGVVFDRGIWEGSDAQIRDRVIVADEYGVVFTIENGQPRRISNNAIEEMVREAMRIQVSVPSP